jgi:hypothetical protein
VTTCVFGELGKSFHRLDGHARDGIERLRAVRVPRPAAKCLATRKKY